MIFHPGRAGVYAILAAATFALTGACIKQAATWIGNEQVVFFRSAIGLLVLLPWAIRAGRAGVATQRLGGHLWRALLGTSAMYCFFYAIPRLPLAEATLLNYSSPLYVPVVAWLWIREKPPASALGATLLGMLGILMIVKPDAGLMTSPAAIIGLVSGMLAAGAMVGIRRISDTEPTTRIVFYFALFSTLVSTVPLLWAWSTPPPPAWLPIAGIGLSATVGQLLLTRAYGLAPAAQVGPYTYTIVLFAAALAWVGWRETLDTISIAGGVLVIASCILAGLRRKEPRLEE